MATKHLYCAKCNRSLFETETMIVRHQKPMHVYCGWIEAETEVQALRYVLDVVDNREDFVEAMLSKEDWEAFVRKDWEYFNKYANDGECWS